MRIVVVAEPKEIEIIPLAYQGLPIIVAGVGEKMIEALEALGLDNAEKIINVGYAGASKDIPLGTTIKFRQFMQSDYKIRTLDYFADSDGGSKKTVYDMEYARLDGWCKRYEIKLEAIKVVSDNCNYKEYKERVG